MGRNWTHRERGYYWVTWSPGVSKEIGAHRSEPLLGHWDGWVWRFTRMERHYFDAAVTVISERIRPPTTMPAPGTTDAAAAA